MSKSVFVITCNDSIEAVVTGTSEQAETKMRQLQDEYFARNRHNFRSGRESFDASTNWAAREHNLIQLGA